LGKTRNIHNFSEETSWKAEEMEVLRIKWITGTTSHNDVN
jgi:hypothetical protein